LIAELAGEHDAERAGEQEGGEDPCVECAAAQRIGDGGHGGRDHGALEGADDEAEEHGRCSDLPAGFHDH